MWYRDRSNDWLLHAVESVSDNSRSKQWLYCLVFDQDSSSVMEWNQCSGGRSQQLLESQQSYETEWDMVNTVSFKKRPCSNTEGKFLFTCHHISF